MSVTRAFKKDYHGQICLAKIWSQFGKGLPTGIWKIHFYFNLIKRPVQLFYELLIEPQKYFVSAFIVLNFKNKKIFSKKSFV